VSIIDRIKNELLALDYKANFALELAGLDPFWRVAIDRLFGEGHCRRAWEGEMEAIVAQLKQERPQ
jgi:hypothetical protein